MKNPENNAKNLQAFAADNDGQAPEETVAERIARKVKKAREESGPLLIEHKRGPATHRARTRRGARAAAGSTE